MEKALSENNCLTRLKELEEPYLTRIDPYFESKPVQDPTWFYGRESLVQRLPAVLAQGQHVGIFGLRKVGKTSLTNQLYQHFVNTPTVIIDCQELPAQAEIYFEEILKQLYEQLKALNIKNLPAIALNNSGKNFRRHFLDLYECWQKAEQQMPFLIFLDENR